MLIGNISTCLTSLFMAYVSDPKGYSYKILITLLNVHISQNPLITVAVSIIITKIMTAKISSKFRIFFQLIFIIDFFFF